ncbi:NAD(P)-binding Rossmann-like domain-containing protein [Roseovarius marisflavi]|uniref:NAD(P)-binding Rossmann-like domain-containing protein n=1 Tax=Roseovarius marisflavi TaxID=1054996 RepID=A0A1M6XHM4_9RHOB|nr:NAD(P)-binding protein [Roseovarius marisflavi]SHL05472.1 NAD(P)-binding Rossmann-like domain-containing protein [Roseovarius marisflavi]
MKNSATSNPVSLTVSIDGGAPVTKTCDLLVVACEPRNLIGTCDYTQTELDLFSKFKNYTFHTTLLKVKVPSPAPEFGIILSPQEISDMAGNVSGYRNETAKQFSLETANGMAENLVTVYQLEGPETTPMTEQQFLDNLNATLPTLSWWPYPDYEIVTDSASLPVDLRTPYFDHFDNAGLLAGGPWDYLDLQGKNNTIYVHGSTCFESVLQCWQYGGMLIENQGRLGWSLPDHKDASIIVLGAGPSGMMFAHRLKELCYTNVEILESTGRFGGKTHTVTYDTPSPNGGQTACELGTCYLSPAYDAMANHFAACDFMVDNIREGMFLTPSHDDPKGKTIRGMTTAGQFDGVPMTEPLIDYTEYTLLKGYYEANQPFAEPAKWLDGFDPDKLKLEMLLKLLEYDALLALYRGLTLPMPLSPPTALLQYDSFYDFLEKNDLLLLTGMLEYAYSVQGYGPLKQIPAYYGLIWISLPLTLGMIFSDKPAVTVLSKGWLDIWTQMAPTLDITLNAHVTGIDRGAVGQVT